MKTLRALPAALVALGLAAPAGAATITIVNNNTAGVGFNDATPATPIGGNPGTTLGEQRLNCFREAARIWGALLQSDVEIKIDATFEPLTCTATSAVLGSAGTNTVHSDFPGALVPATWYHQPLANKLSKADQDDTRSDLRARFNSNLGQSNCLASRSWYYGLDTGHGETGINLVTVLLHEFAHGLGFSTFTSSATGVKFESQDDVYMRLLTDVTTGKGWKDMTDAERKASAINPGNLVWTGANVNRFMAGYLNKRAGFFASAPASVAGTYSLGTADFGPPITANALSGTLVAGTDPSDAAGASTTDGCSALTNAAAVAGKIVLVDRGTCAFVLKVKNAQNAGAIGVLIADNAAGNPPAGLGGTDDSITIPSARLTQDDGAKLRAALPVSGSLKVDPTLLAGGDNQGRALMYSPSPVQQGSSVSHFDVSATPNLLMEPSINGDLRLAVDATLEELRDIGWFAGTAPTSGTWILASSARAGGAGGAFYTTDLAIANRGTAPATYTLKFLNNNVDGRGGAEKTFALAAGKAVTYADVLGSVFDVPSGFGAIQIASPDSGSLKILSQTSTPGAGGTFGQSVPAIPTSDLIVTGAPRAIVAAREDANFRTNLVLVNATEAPVEIEVTVVATDGTVLGTQKQPTFKPLEMRQVSRVIQAITSRNDIVNATLVVSTPTTGGAVAAYAAIIDNLTNDPRTLLATPNVSGSSTVWTLPSSARAGGAGGAFYTTDLTIGNRGTASASFKLKFVSNNVDGREGAEKTFVLAAGKATTLNDVLGTAFGVDAGFGAIRITSDIPDLKILSQTSTPGTSGGTFGQSVPAAAANDLVVNGTPRTIVAAREDARFRTNLILANATESNIEVEVEVLADDGTSMGKQKLASFLPLEMRQVSRVIQFVTGRNDVPNATLIVSTPTQNASFAAYAAVIDNVTNDPRTLLP